MNQNVQINDRQPLRDHLLRELRHRLDQAIASTPRLQAVAELYYQKDLESAENKLPELRAETLTALENGDTKTAKDRRARRHR